MPAGQSRFGSGQSIQSGTGIWSCESHEPGARQFAAHAPLDIALAHLVVSGGLLGIAWGRVLLGSEGAEVLMAGRLAAPLLPALPSSLRHARLQGVACHAQMAQQTSKQAAKSLASWGTGELKSADISRTGSKPESLSTSTTPLDVLLDDVKFLEAKTGLDLMTPLQEVKGVHDQVCLISLQHICGISLSRAPTATRQPISAMRGERGAQCTSTRAFVQVPCLISINCSSIIIS